MAPLSETDPIHKCTPTSENNNFVSSLTIIVTVLQILSSILAWAAPRCVNSNFIYDICSCKKQYSNKFLFGKTFLFVFDLHLSYVLVSQSIAIAAVIQFLQNRDRRDIENCAVSFFLNFARRSSPQFGLNLDRNLSPNQQKSTKNCIRLRSK